MTAGIRRIPVVCRRLGALAGKFD